MNKKEVAHFYMDANQLCMQMGMLLVGWCQGCGKGWGLRHYRLSLNFYRAAQTSSILCSACAKKNATLR